MALDIDNLKELQRLRETVRVREDPSYVPGTIEISEVATTHAVSIHQLISAYQVIGVRELDRYSLLTPECSAEAGKALRRFHELKDPELSKLRRNGHVPLPELASDLKIPVPEMFELCAIIGFPSRDIYVEQWLFPQEQDAIRKLLKARKSEAAVLPAPVAEPFPEPSPTLAASSAPSSNNAQQVTPPVAPAMLRERKASDAVAPAKRAALLVNAKINAYTIERPVIDDDGRRAQKLLSDRILSPTTNISTFATRIGSTAEVVKRLQKTLDTFSPASYAVFFQQMRDALKVDKQIQASMSNDGNGGVSRTTSMHAQFINEVCSYKYGIFAYKDLGAKLGTAAGKKKLATPSVRMEHLHKFRPMIRGLAADESRRQFILWRVNEGSPTLLVIKWHDLRQWVDGMNTGHYLGLKARHIFVAKVSDPVDVRTVKIMIEMADNLRRGVHKRTASPNPYVPTGHSYLSGQRTAPRSTMGYKPESLWLVPITVTGATVETGLDADFFTAYGAKRAHRVRETFRRAPGSPSNAPKTVHVRGHIRGGSLFEDANLLPAVTITGDRD